MANLINFEEISFTLLSSDNKILGFYDNYNKETDGEITRERVKAGEILICQRPVENSTAYAGYPFTYYIRKIGIAVAI